MSIHQHHIEFCQALALQCAPDRFTMQPATPDVVQELWDAIKELSDVENLRHYSDVDAKRFDDENAVRALQENIRGNTRLVRNWGYFSQVTRISRELYQYFDEAVKKSLGFTLTN